MSLSSGLKLKIETNEKIKIIMKNRMDKPKVSKNTRQSKSPVIQLEPLRKKNKGGEKGRNKGMSM